MILVVFIVAIVLWFCSQAVATSNLKRENRESFQRAVENHAQYFREEARKNDYYYNPILRKCEYGYYSDGSLRLDKYTGKRYQKGQYYCDSRGTKADWSQAAPDEKRPQ